MSASVAASARSELDRFAPVDLATLTSRASLQTRFDRKYLVAPAVVDRLLRGLGQRARVLEIDEQRSFSYESVYFDTPDLTAYYAAAHGRRRRFKVRTRTYLESRQCVLEVKTSSGRGETVKARRPHDFEHRAWLTPDAENFIHEHLRRDGERMRLGPVLTTAYQRSTLLDEHGAYRMTCDTGLVCTTPGGPAIALRDHVLVETKSAGSHALPDRLLWAAGHRPVTISKYCVGLAALHAQLPANRWHRTLHRYFDAR